MEDYFVLSAGVICFSGFSVVFISSGGASGGGETATQPPDIVSVEGPQMAWLVGGKLCMSPLKLFAGHVLGG